MRSMNPEGTGIKMSLFVTDSLRAEMEAEARRQDRSLSWLIRRAWRLARDDIRRGPTHEDVIAEATRPSRAKGRAA